MPHLERWPFLERTPPHSSPVGLYQPCPACIMMLGDPVMMHDEYFMMHRPSGNPHIGLRSEHFPGLRIIRSRIGYVINIAIDEESKGAAWLLHPHVWSGIPRLEWNPMSGVAEHIWSGPPPPHPPPSDKHYGVPSISGLDPHIRSGFPFLEWFPRLERAKTLPRGRHQFVPGAASARSLMRSFLGCGVNGPGKLLVCFCWYRALSDGLYLFFSLRTALRVGVCVCGCVMGACYWLTVFNCITVLTGG